MEVYFETDELEYFYQTPLIDIRGKREYSKVIIGRYKRAIQQLIAIKRLEELKQFKGLRFEYLKGIRKKDCSIRLNDQYRLIFRPINDKKIEVLLIKEISKHYE